MPAAPVVLIISLDGAKDMFLNIDKHLMAELGQRADIIHATEPGEAAVALSTRPSAVLVTEPSIIDKKKKSLLDQLVAYVKGGGTVVFAGQFSSFLRPPDMNKMFEKVWGLPWRSGSYTSGENYLRPGRDEGLRKSHLLQSYHFKALFVKNIRQEDALYGQTKRGDLEEAPVAHTKVGEWYLGYSGDVTAHEGSTWAVLAMLGLGTRGIPAR